MERCLFVYVYASVTSHFDNGQGNLCTYRLKNLVPYIIFLFIKEANPSITRVILILQSI